MPSPVELWLLAAKSQVGICIETNDRMLLRAQLYRVRKEQGNPAWDSLVIALPTDEAELWIIPKELSHK